MILDHVTIHKEPTAGPTCWDMVQSELEFRMIGILGLQFLQVLPWDYVLFSLIGKKAESTGLELQGLSK